MFNRVVLSGGAVPALSFFGSLLFLQHVGLLASVDTFVGSSAGTVVGFLTVLGYSPLEACDFFMRTGVDGHTLTEIDVMDAMFGHRTCLDTLGFDDGSKWTRFLEDATELKLSCRDVTFGDLCKATGKVLVVCVTNLSKKEREYLSVETAPHMSVLLAVRMSISVPILYVPVMYQGCLYVDGSLLDNLPVASAPSAPGGPPSTLALCIENEPPAIGADLTHPSAIQYVSMLLGAVVKHAQHNNGNGPARPEVTKVGVRVRPDDASTCGFDLRSFTFLLGRDRLDDLLGRGYAAARDKIEPSLLINDAG